MKELSKVAELVTAGSGIQNLSVCLEATVFHYSGKTSKQMGTFTLIIPGDILSSCKKLEEDIQK